MGGVIDAVDRKNNQQSNAKRMSNAITVTFADNITSIAIGNSK
jgi:hypothetical protein